MDRQNMLRQILLEEEGFIAHRALVPLHLLVNALVVISVRKHLREGKLTIVAGNQIFPESMPQLMVKKLPLKLARDRAHIAIL
mmetsp:Transcript_5336/g.7434  ORF Transcript_5336/g.7434 Transcript_5336/m.7434 type:complete len:83 (-) Transcript_5336:37-285(-)